MKLQVLNLAAKLSLSNPKQTKLLCQYVLNMAKYDLNYDIRAKARFLRTLLVPSEKVSSTQVVPIFDVFINNICWCYILIVCFLLVGRESIVSEQETVQCFVSKFCVVYCMPMILQQMNN